MLLKKLVLNNIRSYTQQEIVFPEGSVLLSGDIGSGKSTVLLAIEFALFGLLRGDLEGGALLRHGCRNGSVELTFSIDGKDTIVRRTLKRANTSIGQDAGHIVRNGIMKEATAVELKNDILELLGYPADLLTKSKSLIYRYTVYTPQEMMKQILLESPDDRLNTLRKVFNIDKYKRIKENAAICVRSLKEEKKVIEAGLADLPEQNEQKEKHEKDIARVDADLTMVLPAVTAARTTVANAKSALASTEERVRKHFDAKRNLDVATAGIDQAIAERERMKKEEEQLAQQVDDERKKLSSAQMPDTQPIAERIKKAEQEWQHANLEMRKLAEETAALNVRKRFAEETKEKVLTLDNCPLCLQHVSHDHKKDITQKQDTIVHDIEDKKKELDEKRKETDESLKSAKERIDRLKQEDKNAAVQRQQMIALKEKEARIETIRKRITESKERIGVLNMKKAEAQQALETLAGSEKEYTDAKERLTAAQEDERKVTIQHATLQKERDGITAMLATIKKNIEKKTTLQQRLARLQELQHWLAESFTPLVETMERHVMARVYTEFNNHFEQWFRMLLEDEMISARLDQSFTPIIQQDGYEVSLDYLSGGEKTACALAYRLALNKAINDVISTIKTRDIIILDEPTDGFSEQQVDKIRDVLRELKAKQVILVSHESKIETFVDNVLRVEKKGHVSEVA